MQHRKKYFSEGLKWFFCCIIRFQMLQTTKFPNSIYLVRRLSITWSLKATKLANTSIIFDILGILYISYNSSYHILLHWVYGFIIYIQTLAFTGWPTKMSLFFFGNNFYRNKETFKIFSPQLLEVYRILLVETTLESIVFYYTFSVVNTMYDPCIRLLYDSTAATRTLKLPTTLLSISCGIHLISPQMMSSLVCGLFSQTLFHHLISRTKHLNTSGITSHGADSFCIKPITPGYSIPKILTCLTIF